MIKTNAVAVMLTFSSIIDKKSPRRAWREERRAVDLKQRPERKVPPEPWAIGFGNSPK
jgi:hypothetical protein